MGMVLLANSTSSAVTDKQLFHMCYKDQISNNKPYFMWAREVKKCAKHIPNIYPHGPRNAGTKLATVEVKLCICFANGYKRMDSVKRVVFMSYIFWVRHPKYLKNNYATGRKNPPSMCRKIHTPLGNVKYCLEDRATK